MSRVSEILVRMRDSLSDNDETRWSDARLIRLIDEAQKDLVQQAKMLRTKTDIAIIGGTAEYELPSDAYLLTRVVDNEDGKIGLLSHDAMDDLSASDNRIGKNWEVTTGPNIEYVIFDKQNPRHFKVYPIPTDDDSVGDTFTLSDYGVTTEVEGDLLTSNYGVVSAVSTTGADTTSFSSPYGVMVDMVSVVASLTIYYRKIPTTIAASTDTPEVDPIWDKALRYYALGMAFADNQDTQNITMSDKFMGMYLRELTEATTQASKNNISASPRNTGYNKAI